MDDLNDERPARCWYLLHVRPRSEKVVARHLQFFRCWHILLLNKVVRKIQRRKVVCELPLFPGYLFAKLNSEERLGILRTGHLLRTQTVLDPRRLIHQLRQIAHAGRRGKIVRTGPLYTAGELVRIQAGPFYGIEARVKRDAGGETVVLNVDLLGQSVEVTLSGADVARCDR